MARPRFPSASPKTMDPSSWPTFLLSQVGAHCAARFAERLAPWGSSRRTQAFSGRSPKPTAPPSSH